jgi:hypothetical protein
MEYKAGDVFVQDVGNGIKAYTIVTTDEGRYTTIMVDHEGVAYQFENSTFFRSDQFVDRWSLSRYVGPVPIREAKPQPAVEEPPLFTEEVPW